MTHFSDFSYLQRCALWIYMGAFLLFKVWTSDRFRCLHPKKILSGELRSIITVMYIIMLFMQASWDIVLTRIKYTESFMVIPGTTTIVSKPYDFWTVRHQHRSQAMDYVECVNLSMQAGVLILLQCFWNYISNSVAKRSFMTSLEFKFYIFWAISSLATFPVLQYVYRESELKRESVPLLAYSVTALIIAFLGVRSHMRFNRMLEAFYDLDNGSAVIERLKYFQEMNLLLTIVLCCYALSLGILCIDGLTAAAIIARSKFATDLLIANCNTCAALMWIVGIFIFHPRRTKKEIQVDDKSRLSDNANSRNATVIVSSDVERSGSQPQELSTTGTFKGRGSETGQRVNNFVNSKNAITSFDSFNSYKSNSPNSTSRIDRVSSLLDKDKKTGLESISSVEIDCDAASPYRVSLPPPQRLKTRLSPKNDRSDNFFHSKDSDIHETNSTVSAYSNYGHTPFQEYAMENRTHTRQNEVNTSHTQVDSSGKDTYDTSWLKQSPERRL